MTEDVTVHHVAVECISQQHADCFFTAILGLPKVKSSVLPKELSLAIFKRSENVRFDFYDDGKTRFEVFITTEQREHTFAHIGLQVDNKNHFISRCKDHGLRPFFVEKEGKQLLFVHDFSNNLYEIKE